MSSSSNIFRANNNSAFYVALKNRASAAGGNACQALYKSEAQSCPSCRSKIEIVSSNNAGYDRKISIPLPNYGFLSKLFLKATFNKAGGTKASGLQVGLTENIGAYLFSEARIVLNGHVLARLNPDYICSRNYKEASQEQRYAFQRLVGGYRSSANGSGVAEADQQLNHPFMDGRSDGEQTYSCPLQFWFDSDESISRALDLNVLDQVFLELDINSEAYCHSFQDTAQSCSLSRLEAVCYELELEPDDHRQYNAVSYSPSQSLSQIGYNITTHTETGARPGVNKEIKLSMFSGQIEKLWIFAMKEEHETVASDRYHYVPVAIDEIKLTATGTTIYEMSKLTNKEKEMEDWVNGVYSSGKGSYADSGAAGGVSFPIFWDSELSLMVDGAELAADGNASAIVTAIKKTKWRNLSQVCPNNVYCINFKEVGSDQRKTSATGSFSMGQASAPNLNIKIATTGNTVPFSRDEASNITAHGDLAKDHKIVVIAEELVLYNYATNNSGRTSLRLITT